jgi:sodium transport system permease protein
MSWRNIGLIFRREVSDQLRDRRTLFMIAVLPVLLYPAMGIGMMQLMLLFSEQPRTVVMLGAEHLPGPPLIEESRFRADWFNRGGEQDKLKLVTDLPRAESGSPNEASPSEADAQKIQKKLATAREIASLLASREQAVGGVTSKADQPTGADLAAKERLELLNQKFSTSGFQVLVIVPEGLKERIAEIDAQLVERSDNGPLSLGYPRPVIVQNSADDKSLIAAQRVQAVIGRWERRLSQEQLKLAGLPPDLPTPIDAEVIDLAQDEQLSNTIWSKLFPALLIIMAVTGAFYPAIDLGAGEKERGTMETLLISPATRTEIVLGKFLTVMLFSMSTALLNLGSLGLTGKYMVSLATAGPLSRIGALAPPPVSSLVWVVIVLIPLAALFSALCLALATFARSSKEGQYYLTPMLMITLGLTLFCLSPAVEIQPFYSVLPVMGPALLLKGMLAGGEHTMLYLYAIPVLLTSIGYSLLAIWWAIDQFGSEDVLFREAERFELGAWLAHLLRDKEPLPTFSLGIVCFALIMFLQFGALKVFQQPMSNVTPEARDTLLLQLLLIQQMVIIATPALLMGVMLTSSPWQTFLASWPKGRYLLLGLILPLALHPLSLELSAGLSWFFPQLPENIVAVLKTISSDDQPVWLVLLAFALAPAVCEELAFRGFILSGFRQRGRAAIAIALSSLAFGVMHLIPQQVFNAALLGLVLGALAVRSRSLLPCIVFHFTYNSLEVLRNRYGSGWQPIGITEWLFTNQGESLRYQPLLLCICGIVAAAGLSSLLWVNKRPRLLASAAPSPAPFAQSP